MFCVFHSQMGLRGVKEFSIKTGCDRFSCNFIKFAELTTSSNSTGWFINNPKVVTCQVSSLPVFKLIGMTHDKRLSASIMPKWNYFTD